MAYDAQSNGVAERAVGDVKNRTGAMKLGLESRLGIPIDLREQEVDRIIRYSISFLNKFYVGANGGTAFYSIHQKNFNGKVFEMGEQAPAEGKRRVGGDGNESSKARRRGGTWLGWDDRTGEQLVALSRVSAVRINSVRPVPAGEP